MIANLNTINLYSYLINPKCLLSTAGSNLVGSDRCNYLQTCRWKKKM